MTPAALKTTAPSTSPAIDIRPFNPQDPADAAAFFALNEQWISRHFGMEPRDHLNLGNPQASILALGGHILMAYAGNRAVGCCALIPEPPSRPEAGASPAPKASTEAPTSPAAQAHPPHVFELAKMAVAEDLRGHGLGRRILLATVDLARSLGARRLTLGSSTRLADAVHLYESIGFRHLPVDRRPPTLYARADVFMEMDL